MLWAVFTLIAAAAQTARNAMQRELTASLGTVGATHVRFLFGFPFAILFLIGSQIDYETSRLSAKFVFHNPNETDACGCGESVTIVPANAAE